MQHCHMSAALQRVLKLLGSEFQPDAVPSRAVDLAADRLAWPACGQPCLYAKKTIGQKLTGTGCIAG